MTIRKCWCSVVEGAVYEDRCLYKLSKVIDGDKTCENCILRELEDIKSFRIKKKDLKKMGGPRARRKAENVIDSKESG